jgi:nicotinate-nucleotide adenylyltransferase
MNIGVYGGTFNPIHFGHLRAAEEICYRFRLSKVLFVPSAQPPHKNCKEIIDPLHRLKMATLAITGNEHFQVSDIEVNRSGKSYTIDTLRELKRQNPEKNFYFIAGLDAFREIHTWHRWRELFAETDFVVTSRPGVPEPGRGKLIPAAVRREFKYSARDNVFVHRSGCRVYFVKVTGIDISSSAIRKMVREGQSIRYLLPRRAIEYIVENKLYR